MPLNWELEWKPNSLSILPSYYCPIGEPTVVAIPGGVKVVPIVTELQVWGDSLDRTGSSGHGAEHGTTKGTKKFFLHRKLLRPKGNLADRLHTWCSVPASASSFACRSWALPQGLLKYLRTWELKHLRDVLGFR